MEIALILTLLIIIWQQRRYSRLKNKFGEYLGKLDKKLEKDFRKES